MLWPRNPQILAGILVIISCNELAYGKIHNKSKKSSLSWPNFFNPKQSILRGNDQKEAIKEGVDKEETERLDNAGSDDNEAMEQLIDYTIKGGLRGTYVVLNSSASLDPLEDNSRKAIQNILKVDENLFEEVDQEFLKGEITDIGVRLRTPMILKVHSKALGKYGSRISFYDGAKFEKLIYFGNWCGRGGRSAPVDSLDACCLEHEKCYGKNVRQCPDVWQKPYRLMYAWLTMNADPVCVRSDSTCVNNVCECDREAALCVRHYVQNPSQIPFQVNSSPRLPKFSDKQKKKLKK